MKQQLQQPKRGNSAVSLIISTIVFLVILWCHNDGSVSDGDEVTLLMNNNDAEDTTAVSSSSSSNFDIDNEITTATISSSSSNERHEDDEDDDGTNTTTNNKPTMLHIEFQYQIHTYVWVLNKLPLRYDNKVFEKLYDLLENSPRYNDLFSKTMVFDEIGPKRREDNDKYHQCTTSSSSSSSNIIKDRLCYENGIHITYFLKEEKKAEVDIKELEKQLIYDIKVMFHELNDKYKNKQATFRFKNGIEPYSNPNQIAYWKYKLEITHPELVPPNPDDDDDDSYWNNKPIDKAKGYLWLGWKNKLLNVFHNETTVMEEWQYMYWLNTCHDDTYDDDDANQYLIDDDDYHNPNSPIHGRKCEIIEKLYHTKGVINHPSNPWITKLITQSLLDTSSKYDWFNVTLLSS